MIPTLSWINKKFDEFNKEYFNGSLRKCAFEVSSTRSAWGTCKWKYIQGTVRRISYGGRVIKTADVKAGSEKISISKFFDCEERHLEETLVHEMIHLMMVQTGRAHVHHGIEFKREARRITSKGKHVITVTDDTPCNVTEETRRKYAREFKVVVLKNKYDGSMWYMTAAPGISEARLSKVVKEALAMYPKYFVTETCVSRHDMFCRRRATIKPNGGWSIYKFSSNEECEDMLRTSRRA